MRLRARFAAIGLCVGAMLVAGCGETPAEAPPSPAASTATTPVAQGPGSAAGSSGGDAVSGVASGEGPRRRGSLKRFVRAADRVCARSNRRAAPFERRAEALGRRLRAARGDGNRPDFGAAADLFDDAADHLEREHERLRALDLPRWGSGGERVLNFLDDYEQVVVTSERLAVELRARDELPSFLRSVSRAFRITARNERAARALGMKVCGTSRTSAR